MQENTDTHNVLVRFIRALDLCTNPAIPKEELLCIATLAYYCGAKMKELLSLKLSDIQCDQNGDPNAVTFPGGTQIQIPNEGKSILRRYLERNWSLQDDTQDIPLLPTYATLNHENALKKIARHLTKVPSGFKFNSLTQDGIKDAYAKTLEATRSREEAIKNTALLFRRQARSVRNLTEVRRNSNENWSSYDDSDEIYRTVFEYSYNDDSDYYDE